jgi:hypothetical protein
MSSFWFAFAFGFSAGGFSVMVLGLAALAVCAVVSETRKLREAEERRGARETPAAE